jgi:hypothetical protein
MLGCGGQTVTQAGSGHPVPVGPASVAPTVALAPSRVWAQADWAVLAATGAWFLWVLDEGSAPITDMFASLLVAPTGGALMLAWAAVSAFGRGAFQGWRRAATWAAVPLVWVAAGWVMVSDRPVAARVWLSEAELRAYVDNPGPRPDRRRVGWFSTEYDSANAGTELVRTGSAFTDIGGVAYAPSGPPAARPHLYFYHLYGPWYRWRYSD